MNTNSVSAFQEFIHAGSIVVLGIIIVIGVLSAIKPGLFKRFYQSFRREYAIAACAFAGLICGTVFIATKPSNRETHVSENTQQTISAIDPLQPAENTPAEQIKTEDVEMKEAIPYPKEQRQDPVMAPGQTKLLQAGKDGELIRIYTITYHNGTETGRVLKSETVALAAVPEVTSVGTKPASPETSSKPNGNSETKKSRSLRDFLPHF